jgi:hypothetical protein
MAKKIEVTCPNCASVFEAEIPKAPVKRGQLYGIALTDMTDEQLKREIINAKSVLYKAIQRGAADEVIAANQARVDRALAEKAKRAAAAAPVVAENVEAAIEGDTVYSENVSSEI